MSYLLAGLANTGPQSLDDGWALAILPAFLDISAVTLPNLAFPQQAIKYESLGGQKLGTDNDCHRVISLTFFTYSLIAMIYPLVFC